MFKHLLLPTDGSKLSEAMIHKAIAFARDAHAQVRTARLNLTRSYMQLKDQGAFVRRRMTPTK